MKKKIILGFVVTLVVLAFGHQLTFFIDLTSDRRFSLSAETKSKLKELNSPLKITVFLDGELPPDFLRLRSEIKTLLEVMKSKNDKIVFEFIDPFISNNTIQQIITDQELTPEMVYQTKNSKVNEFVVFPWALINDGSRFVKVPLLQKNLGDRPEEKIQRSIQQLEYQLLDGIHRLTLERKQNIAVLTSHNTSEEIKIADFLQSLKPYYNLAAFDLKATEISALKSLKNLQRFDLLIVPNPKKPFTQEEKYILDQFTLNGGKSLWLIDALSINRDSLFNQSGKTIGVPNELNLDDFFFNYGIRIQKKLLKDLYSAPIVIAQGTENNTNFIPLPWVYYPLPKPENNHPVSKGLGPVLMQFTSAIDTLKNSIDKQILLNSSDFIKTMGVPVIVSLEEASKKIDPSVFNESKVPLAVLLEGEFESLFKNRIKPFQLESVQKIGDSKMLVISDGDFAENQSKNGVPLTLGYDKWTNNFYANKDFLVNSVHFLIAESKRINLRNKEVSIAFLDAQKVETSGSFWKVMILALPLSMIIVMGILNQYLRKRTYTQ